MYKQQKHDGTCYLCACVVFVLVLCGVQSTPPPKFGDLGPREGMSTLHAIFV